MLIADCCLIKMSSTAFGEHATLKKVTLSALKCVSFVTFLIPYQILLKQFVGLDAQTIITPYLEYKELFTMDSQHK